MNSTDTPPLALPPDAVDLPALPALYHAIPEPGRKISAGPYAGSSDALALAQLARECARANRVVAVVTGDPHSAQRLSEEIPWFAPELRVALFAQELKTPVPVSVKRVAKMWQTMSR